MDRNFFNSRPDLFFSSKKINLISCHRSINTEISRELLDTGHFEVMTVEADEDEHSIEMQLPYIAKVGKESPNSIS